MAARTVAVLCAALLLSPVLAGCVTLTAAHVPTALLDGRNGWAEDDANSQDEPDSAAFGTTKTQRKSYKDEAKDKKGYQGTLAVFTLRTLISPSDEKVLDGVEDQVRDLAEAQGIRIDQEAAKGERTLKNGADSVFFVYNGTASKSSGFFAVNSRIKVMGEAFQCRAERTTVVMVALAQVTETQSFGGVAFPNHKPDTWRELVADPTGTVEGYRGADGLMFNVACS